jgi:hypothetical protein
MAKISKMLILSVLVVALAAPAFATTSRVISLANAAPYMNDDSDVFRWYGTISSYNNMVMAEAGQASIGGFGLGDVDADYQALGFTKSLGKDAWLGTWGIFLLYNSLDDMSFFYNNPLGTIGSEGTLSTPTTKFVLSWGNEIEDVLAYGITFTHSNAMVEATPGSKDDVKFLTLGGGVRGDIGDKAYYDAAITFGTASGDTIGGYDKGTSGDFAFRAFYEWLDDLTLVPYFDWNMYEYAYKNIAATSGSKVSDVTLGLSMNWDVNTNNMLLFATELEWYSWKPSKVASGDQEEFKATVLPKFYVALESDITSWLTTRVGASKMMLKTEDTFSNGDKLIETGPSSPGGDFDWSLGAGFHLGEWDVDLVFSHEMPFRLGYWITGFGSFDPDPPVGRISGTYRF